MKGDKERPKDVDEHRHDDDDDDGEDSLRQRVEESLARVIPDLVKKAVETGWGTVSRTDSRKILSFVNDIKLPRDVARYFLNQVDDTKNALLRIFAREVREFLEHTDLAEDMRKVLTSVSLEVSTRVRFVPNEATGGIKPEVNSTVLTSEKKSRKGAFTKDSSKETSSEE